MIGSGILTTTLVCIFFSFGQLDIMYQLEDVHFLVDEMVQNGYVIETNRTNILRPIALMERESAKAESMFR